MTPEQLTQAEALASYLRTQNSAHADMVQGLIRAVRQQQQRYSVVYVDYEGISDIHDGGSTPDEALAHWKRLSRPKRYRKKARWCVMAVDTEGRYRCACRTVGVPITKTIWH